MKERAREIADQGISGEVTSLHRKFSSPQFKRDRTIVKVLRLVLIMERLKDLCDVKKSSIERAKTELNNPDTRR